MCLIDTLRKIVTDYTAEEIDGMVVDVQTASVIVKVHDILVAEKQEKLMSMPIGNIATCAWRCVK